MPASKRNTFQYLVSYLFDAQIESVSSPYNPVLNVKYYEGGYILDADTVNFSFGALHRVFQLAFDKIDIDKRPIESVLILGYGGGSVAQLLNERLTNLSIVGVEIDSKIIRIARDYFHLDDIKNLHIEEMDAALFVEQCSDQFDMIVIDIFNDNLVPEKFFDEFFLKSIKGILNPGAMVVFNAAVIGSGQRFEELGKVFKEIYPETRTLAIEANKLLVWEDVT